LTPVRIPRRSLPKELFEEIEAQAEQGGDFMTVHCGITKRASSWAMEEGGRIMGIVFLRRINSGLLDAHARQRKPAPHGIRKNP
jgi:hypothetical protein